VSQRALSTAALGGPDASHGSGLSAEARVALACLACVSKGARHIVATRAPGLAALCAKEHALRVLPALLCTYQHVMRAPSEDQLAAHMAMLRASARPPPLVFGTFALDEDEGETMSSRLGAVHLRHLAPQLATTAGGAWMALVDFVGWCMNHPRMRCAFEDSYERMVAKADNPDVALCGAGVLDTIRNAYRAELRCIMPPTPQHAVPAPMCFPYEVGYIGPADDERAGVREGAVGEMVDAMMRLAPFASGPRRRRRGRGQR
jgi:hypothetical protein